MAACVVEHLKLIRTFAELRDRACELGPKRVGVVLAEDDVALAAASDALLSRIALPVLIGDERKIRGRAQALGLDALAANAEYVAAGENAAELAVGLARAGSIDILMKGHLRTDQLFHPVLDRQNGLRTGRLLCDVALFEHHDAGNTRLVATTDGGITIAPSLEQKKQIILSAIEVLRCLGIDRPNIADHERDRGRLQRHPVDGGCARRSPQMAEPAHSAMPKSTDLWPWIMRYLAGRRSQGHRSSRRRTRRLPRRSAPSRPVTCSASRLSSLPAARLAHVVVGAQSPDPHPFPG